MSRPGIYRIVHVSSGRCYVGQTSNLDGFAWEELECCDVEELTAREQFWMDLLRPLLFNHSPAAGSVLGIKRSEATRQRLSEAAMGNTRAAGRAMSDANKQALLAANKGRPLSAEHRAKLADRKLGNTNAIGHRLPDEVKDVIAQKLSGNRNASGKRSAEVRARMSVAQQRRFAGLPPVR